MKTSAPAGRQASISATRLSFIASPIAAAFSVKKSATARHYAKSAKQRRRQRKRSGWQKRQLRWERNKYGNEKVSLENMAAGHRPGCFVFGRGSGGCDRSGIDGRQWNGTGAPGRPFDGTGVRAGLSAFDLRGSRCGYGAGTGKICGTCCGDLDCAQPADSAEWQGDCG